MATLLLHIGFGIFLAAKLIECVRDGRILKSEYALANISQQSHMQTHVLELARRVLRDFRAGSGYGKQVWIRDTNTFIDEILQERVLSGESVKRVLFEFLKHQDPEQGVPDWVELGTNKNEKNTVETDQETSLIQALHKYVAHTHDSRVLDEKIESLDGEVFTVKARIEHMFEYLKKHRLSSEHNLLFGATTVDWGDVQAKGDGNVILMGSGSHLSIDIYDNAMMVQALSDFADMLRESGDTENASKYGAEAEDWKQRVRAALWDESQQKWRPHLYFTSPQLGLMSRAGSPFPDTFDENSIYYHGGTSVAMLAGLNTEEEGRAAYYRMKANAEKVGHGNGLTVGLTVHPTYPETHVGMKPYFYQNGGDWPWFGGRTVQALVKMGHMKEAREALKPMLERTIRDEGFHEWYDQDNKPQGSASFHGAAGVLAKAIRMLQADKSSGNVT